MKKMLVIAVLAVALVMGMVAYATAANTVTVTAKVNPKFTLTMTDQTLAFGDIYPDDVVTKTAALNVRSNTTYKIDYSKTSGDDLASLLNLQVSGLDNSGASFPKAPSSAGQDHTVDFKLNGVPWTTDTGNYSAVYTFTVTQP